LDLNFLRSFCNVRIRRILMNAARLATLYQEIAPDLLRYLSRRHGDGAAAEDLLQETFAAVLRNPAGFEAALSPRAYLFGIARNLSARTFREDTTHVTLCEFTEFEDAPSAVPAEQDPRLELVRAEISKLKPDLRETLELRLDHELSYQEIAVALEIPIGTVRSRLHEAMLRLRQALNQDAREVQRKESAL
jgi:RNA polymerase sigma-70 factor, ECF subfamily